MADIDSDLLDEGDEDTDDASDSSDSTEQQGVTVEDLQQQIRALQASVAASDKRHRDVIAAVGRVQSAQAKFERAAGTGTAEAAKLQASVKAANDSIDALLEDEAIDPKVRDKVRSVRAAATSNSELEDLRRQMAALQAGRQDDDHEAMSPGPAGNATALSAFEQAMEAAIVANDLDPDSDLFDWAGEASKLYRESGREAAQAYFVKQIKSGLEARAQASRRETRRTSGTAGAKPAGNAQNELEVGTVEERMKALRAMGAV